MRLAEMSWTDARDTNVDVVLLPVGSTEQHGPHAPLGTDWMLAEAVADRAQAESEHSVVIAPTLPIGVAAEHRAFAGTLWLSPDTFRETIRETVSSIAHHGWDHVIIVNGHGGNIAALNEICAAITREDIAHCVPFTWFDSIDLPSDIPMGHAGAIETAGILATHPELVDTDRADTAGDDAADRWGKWVAGVNLAVDSNAFTENGVVGDPSLADADLGESALEQASVQLATLIDAITAQD